MPEREQPHAAQSRAIRGVVKGRAAPHSGGVKAGLNILLLAGSAEARQIARALGPRDLRLRALVSEPPRGPDPMPIPCRMHPFDDPASLAEQMQDVDAVIDASHGFDGTMTEVGFAAAGIADVPFVTLTRPVWEVSEHPKWRSARDLRAAMPMIPAGARVFAATGWTSLPACARFPGDRLLLRQTVPHDRPPPFDFVDLIFGEAPFTPASETALFKALHVDMLICRNLGGLPSRPKLEAAKALDLPVILIDRPARPEGAAAVQGVQAVLDWVEAL